MDQSFWPSLLAFLGGYATNVGMGWLVDKGKQGLDASLVAFSGQVNNQESDFDDNIRASDADEVDNLWQDRGEPLRFLTRQRVRYRIALAKERWELLRVIAHYHPFADQGQKLPLNFRPEALNGMLTVADFAAELLPGEKERFPDSVSSKARLQLVESSLERIGNITTTIHQGLEPAICEVPAVGQVKMPNWLPEAGFIAWVSLLCEIAGKQFATKANLKSFCGLKDFKFIKDSPVEGIRQRKKEDQDGTRSGKGCNIFAYAATTELARVLSRVDGEFRTIYKDHFDPVRWSTAHKYALGRVAVKLLDRAHTFLTNNPPPRHLITPTITFVCSSCQARLVSTSKTWGKRCKCPKCSHVFLVPTPDQYGESGTSFHA